MLTARNHAPGYQQKHLWGLVRCLYKILSIILSQAQVKRNKIIVTWFDVSDLSILTLHDHLFPSQEPTNHPVNIHFRNLLEINIKQDVGQQNAPHVPFMNFVMHLCISSLLACPYIHRAPDGSWVSSFNTPQNNFMGLKFESSELLLRASFSPYQGSFTIFKHGSLMLRR